MAVYFTPTKPLLPNAAVLIPGPISKAPRKPLRLISVISGGATQSRIRGALANCSSTLRSLRASRPLRPCMTASAAWPRRPSGSAGSLGSSLWRYTRRMSCCRRFLTRLVGTCRTQRTCPASRQRVVEHLSRFWRRCTRSPELGLLVRRYCALAAPFTFLKQRPLSTSGRSKGRIMTVDFYGPRLKHYGQSAGLVQHACLV
jgi:hypothetical protein